MLIAFLVLLFGDNLYERWHSSSNQHEEFKTPDVMQTLSADNGTEVVTENVISQPNKIFEAMCNAGSVSIKFDSFKNDRPRYLRRSGTTIVAIRNCAEHDLSFDTELDGRDTFGIDGMVSDDTLSFKYSYNDNEGFVDCRVVASGSLPQLFGNIFCEGARDAMSKRRAIVSIADQKIDRAP